MTEAELRKMTVKQLRELAAEKTDIAGITGMKKEELVTALIGKLGIDISKKVTDEALKDKKSAKKEVFRLKQKKQEVLQGKTKNIQQLRNIRRRVGKLKRYLRKV